MVISALIDKCFPRVARAWPIQTTKYIQRSAADANTVFGLRSGTEAQKHRATL